MSAVHTVLSGDVYSLVTLVLVAVLWRLGALIKGQALMPVPSCCSSGSMPPRSV